MITGDGNCNGDNTPTAGGIAAADATVSIAVSAIRSGPSAKNCCRYRQLRAAGLGPSNTGFEVSSPTAELFMPMGVTEGSMDGTYTRKVGCYHRDSQMGRVV